MNTMDDRIGTLEMRIERLETWAGPGQTEALSVNVRAIRADLVAFRGVQKKHGVQLDMLTKDMARVKDDVAELKVDVAALKDDVADLKTAVAELKTAVAEILRRLPSPAD